MRRIDISITEQLLIKLREHKKLTGLSISDIIRRALERYFEEKRG